MNTRSILIEYLIVFISLCISPALNYTPRFEVQETGKNPTGNHSLVLHLLINNKVNVANKQYRERTLSEQSFLWAPIHLRIIEIKNNGKYTEFVEVTGFNIFGVFLEINRYIFFFKFYCVLLCCLWNVLKVSVFKFELLCIKEEAQSLFVLKKDYIV